MTVTDVQIRQMLEERADRAQTVDPAGLQERIAAAARGPQTWGWRPRLLVRWAPRLVVLGVLVVAAVLAAGTLGGALARIVGSRSTGSPRPSSIAAVSSSPSASSSSRPTVSGTPTGSGSPPGSVAPRTPAPTPSSATPSPVPTPEPTVPGVFTPMTARELGARLREGSQLLEGKLIIVSGQLERSSVSTTTCFDRRSRCREIHLRGLSPALPVQPADPASRGPWSRKRVDIDGTFVISVTAQLITYEGPLVPPATGERWTPTALDAATFVSGPRRYLVHGWLVASPRTYQPHCASATLPPSAGGLDYGCGEIDYITDTADDALPVSGLRGLVGPPPHGIQVQKGSYAAFAPDPDVEDRLAREGDFLISRQKVGCDGVPGTCRGEIHWVLESALEPRPGG